MKKNVYLWIFIGVAVLICTLLLVLAINLSNKNNTDSVINIPNSRLNNKDAQAVSEEKIDLTQKNVDFEDDAEDLADSFVDDSQFDEVENLDSIEDQIY